MKKERLQQVLDNLIGWAMDHSPEFLNDFIAAAGFTKEELYESGLDDIYIMNDNIENEEDVLEQFFQSILELDDLDEDYEDDDYNTEEVNDYYDEVEVDE